MIESEPNKTESSPFPTALLPETMANLIWECSANLGTPEALPAISALGVCSASIGKGLIMRNGPNWITRASLYILGGARSGSGKSETAKIVANPILKFQQEKLTHWKSLVSPKIEAEIAINKIRISQLENKTRQNIEENKLRSIREDLKKELVKKRELYERSHEPSLVVADITSEKLALVLSHNSEVIFSFSPDARQVLKIVSGLYSGKNWSDEAIYLHGYSGDFIKVDRIGRQEPIILNEPCICTLWLVQPDVLMRLFENEELIESGFLARFLYVNTNAKAKKFTPEELLSDHSSISSDWEWNELIRDLLNKFHQAQEPLVVHSTTDALSHINEYRNSVIDRTQSELIDVEIFTMRWAEQAWRLALVLHAAEHGSKSAEHPICLDIAQRAVKLMDWFAEQQLEILTKGRNKQVEKEEDQIEKLFERLRIKAGQDFMTERDVYKRITGGDKEKAKAILDRLVIESFLVVEKYQDPNGGRPSPRYRQNAKFKSR